MNLSEFFACPKCKGNLVTNVTSYVCDSCQEAYLIEGDVPIFLIGHKTDSYSKYWDKGWQNRFDAGDYDFHKKSDDKFAEIINNSLEQSKETQTPITSVKVRRKNQSLLNIGCGMNEASFITMMGVDNYIGIDYSYSAAKYSLESIRKLGGYGVTVQANAEILPIKSQSIDQVYSSGVLHHTPNIEITLDEIYRVLKPSGRGVIGLYSTYSPKFIVARIIGTLRALVGRKGTAWYAFTEGAWKTDGLFNPWTKTFSRKEMINMFAKYNYSEVKIRSTGFQWGDSFPIIGKYIAKTRIGKKSAIFLSNILGSMWVITFKKIGP